MSRPAGVEWNLGLQMTAAVVVVHETPQRKQRRCLRCFDHVREGAHVSLSVSLSVCLSVRLSECLDHVREARSIPIVLCIFLIKCTNSSVTCNQNKS